MIISLEETKQWLRIDGDDDDGLLNSLINSAELYLKNATGITYGSENELAKLYCLILIAHWYENRNAVVVGTVTKPLEFSLQNILLQLTYGGDDSESSTI